MSRDNSAKAELKVLLIDDHVLFRAGMRYLLKELPYSIQVKEASSEGEIRNVLQEERPDIVLLDLVVRDYEPQHLLRKVLAEASGIPVLVVSSSDEPDLIHMALEQGAAGFVPKSSSPEVMLQAVLLVLSGGIYVPPAILKLLRHSHAASASPGEKPPPVNLSERQHAVLECLAKGYSNKQIARALAMSEGSVKAHVASLFKVLGAKNRTQAILLATERGLIR